MDGSPGMMGEKTMGPQHLGHPVDHVIVVGSSMVDDGVKSMN